MIILDVNGLTHHLQIRDGQEWFFKYVQFYTVTRSSSVFWTKCYLFPIQILHSFNSKTFGLIWNVLTMLRRKYLRPGTKSSNSVHGSSS